MNKRESFECVVFRPRLCKSSTRFTIFQKRPPEVVEGRRTLEIKFDRFGGLNLESSIADQINRSLEERVRSRFKLEITSWIQLQNTEDGSMMDWFNRELGESPWFETLVAAREWVSRQEEARLANIDRPNTKWSYELTKSVYVKVILDRHPLFLGLGQLPDWLRNKRGVLSLDTYDDNRCLFRCIAVHRGAHVQGTTCAKQKSLRSPFSPNVQVCEIVLPTNTYPFLKNISNKVLLLTRCSLTATSS